MSVMTTLEERNAICSILRNLDRDDRRRILEDAISQLRPDGIEAEELLHAVIAGLKNRYEDLGQDAYQALDDACEAVVELYDEHGEDPLNPFDQGPDPMDLARQRREMEEAI